MGDIVQYWPIIAAIGGVIAWGARLEQKTANTVKREEHATQVQALKDVKGSVERIERKVDRLLDRH